MSRFLLYICIVLFFVSTAVAGSVDGGMQAQHLLASGQADAAVTALQAHVKQFPTDAAAWNLLSRAYLLEEKWDSAMTAGEKATSLEPDNSDYHLWLGRAYGMRAEHSIFVTAIRLAKKVRGEFERAVQLQDNNLAAQSDLAEFFIEAPGFLGGGVDKAQRTAEKVASTDAATAHWIQARIAEKDKRGNDAEKEYRAAIAAARDKAPYYLNLASFYRRQARYADMEQAIDSAASAERSHDDVLFEGAELLVRAGRNLPTATQWLRRYLTSNSQVESAPTFQAHYLLGSIMEKQGDRQGAAAEYRQALALASAFEPAQEALRRVSNQ